MMDLKTHLFINQQLILINRHLIKKNTDYVLSWKSKGVFISKLKPLYTTLLKSIKLSEYRIGIKLEKDLLAVEQNNHFTKL